MGLFSFPLIDSDLTAWFILDGKEYEISQFNIGFGQSIDVHKGQPQDEVRGGIMTIVLTQALSDNLYRWAMTSSAKSGEIVFRSKTANAPLRITFINAYCTNFDRLIAHDKGIITSLTISPDEIMINGISFDNHWV